MHAAGAVLRPVGGAGGAGVLEVLLGALDEGHAQGRCIGQVAGGNDCAVDVGRRFGLGRRGHVVGTGRRGVEDGVGNADDEAGAAVGPAPDEVGAIGATPEGAALDGVDSGVVVVDNPSGSVGTGGSTSPYPTGARIGTGWVRAGSDVSASSSSRTTLPRRNPAASVAIATIRATTTLADDEAVRGVFIRRNNL